VVVLWVRTVSVQSLDLGGFDSDWVAFVHFSKRNWGGFVILGYMYWSRDCFVI
jgi:hypothetical protein